MPRATHTPGPWAISPLLAGGQAHVGTEDLNVALVYWTYDGEGVANKHLIAAAPDLLAACKAVLLQIEYGDPTPTGDLIEAIAKAEGRAV